MTTAIGDIAAVPQVGSASYSLTVAEGFGDTDLEAQPLYPDHAPQLVVAHNVSDAEEDFNYTDYKGTTHSRPLAGGESFPIPLPVSSAEATSGDSIMFTAFWWPADRHSINPSP